MLKMGFHLSNLKLKSKIHFCAVPYLVLIKTLYKHSNDAAGLFIWFCCKDVMCLSCFLQSLLTWWSNEYKQCVLLVFTKMAAASHNLGTLDHKLDICN